MLKVARGLLELLLPTRCVLCQRLGARVVCAECAAGLEPVGVHCARCGRRRDTQFASPDCGECFGQSIGVRRARSAYIYNAPGRALLAEFKYHRKVGAGLVLLDGLLDMLQGDLARSFDSADADCQMVVPVPLHVSRLATRRFNQSELLARRLANSLHLPCQPRALLRTRETPSQVGLSANQRMENVRGAFAVNSRVKPALAGANVLLVDDLMTTGATLAACARTLRRGGARDVYGVTLFSTYYSAATDP